MRSGLLRHLRGATVAVLLAGTGLLAVPAPAVAHPLGNTTVNHYDELLLSPEGLQDKAVVDTAEIPTFQRRSRVDLDHNGAVSAVEGQRYANTQCSAMASEVSVRVGGVAVPTTVATARYSLSAGQVGLPTGRLECTLRAAADLRASTTVDFENHFDDDGVGWHEVVARGEGVVLHDSPFPASSISDGLRNYPDDLLTSPLDVRGGTVRVAPGRDAASTYLAAGAPRGAGPVARAADGLTRSFNGVVGREQLTPVMVLLGIVLAALVGAGHALLPGHGKTVMAAYLVGRQGRFRDVLTVGATVTLTHTLGVLVIGLLLSAGAAVAPQAVDRALGLVSGVLIAAVGGLLLRSSLRARRARHEHDHHDHHHPHGHDHPHPVPFTRSGLVGLGVAGGLVPSPSALLVLLGAVALGRTPFGVVLVLAYGAGMALVLCLAGLLLVRVGRGLGGMARMWQRPGVAALLSALPLLTAGLLLLVGTALAVRAGVPA